MNIPCGMNNTRQSVKGEATVPKIHPFAKRSIKTIETMTAKQKLDLTAFQGGEMRFFYKETEFRNSGEVFLMHLQGSAMTPLRTQEGFLLSLLPTSFPAHLGFPVPIARGKR